MVPQTALTAALKLGSVPELYCRTLPTFERAKQFPAEAVTVFEAWVSVIVHDPYPRLGRRVKRRIHSPVCACLGPSWQGEAQNHGQAEVSFHFLHSSFHLFLPCFFRSSNGVVYWNPFSPYVSSFLFTAISTT
jgi:hypothetical protein